MTGERAALEALIESVADGGPVDWEQLEAAAGDERTRRRVRNLRLVAEVAAVHRSHVEAETHDEVSPPDGSGEGHERWGHLLLVAKIAEGTFGTVYRARDPWLDRDVALKLLKPSAGDAATSRVLHEAQTLARVRHPNVVVVHGAAVHDGRVGLWMEFVHGQTMSDVLASHGAFGASEAAVAGQELCRALAAVHAAGLVHRDVKAANVMREAGGRLVLMDFGAGQRVALADASRRELVGTPLYLSPERLAGDPATTRSDIYALGVLLHHLVTGDYPIHARSIEELRAAHQRGETRRLSDVRPDLPESFVRAVERALSPDPAQRYATAGEMQAALAGVATTDTDRGRATTRPWWSQWSRGRLVVAVAIAALCVGLAMALRREPATAPPAAAAPGRVRLLAILPFQNASSDPGEAYLANAVPMELAARLGHVGALRVVPWTFMRRFDIDRPFALKEVAERTGADTIVEGAVQRVPGADGSPGPVHVRVQIFEASSGTLLWSDSFERDIGDFFVVQAQIARAIELRLQIYPASRDQALVSRSRQVPPDAMEDYLAARHLLEIDTNFPRAAALFGRATERAPAFAEAFVGLAWCHALESEYDLAMTSDVALQRSLDASNRAIAIDPDMPEAWAVRAFAHFALDGNWTQAGADFTRALDLGPESSEVLQSYSNYLTDLGRHADAIEAARKAEARAPFSAGASRQLAWAFYIGRQYDNAIAQARRALEIEPGFVPARTVLGRALVFAGRFTDGVRELEAVGGAYENMLAACYALAGRRDDAQRLLNRMLADTNPQVRSSYQIATVYATLGDATRAMDWLETAYTRRDPTITQMSVDPLLDAVRDQPRFRALRQKVGPPE